MTKEPFERLLDEATDDLTESVRSSTLLHDPKAFQQGVHDALRRAAKARGLEASPTFHPHAFPDIRVNGFGVEVKYTKQDTWLSVGNSIFEGMRDSSVSQVYVVFGKIGGEPEVRWSRYEDCITHVRVSHSPRFVVEMDHDRSSLFERMRIGYDDFSALSDSDKMRHIRDYSRGRLKEGERLWWLEESHAVPMAVRFYMSLEQIEKRTLRAEAALLCPQICAGPRSRNKYNDAALYLLLYHGVFCPQARDLFSAGSVALREDERRGGLYILRALRDIEDLMRDAAYRLEGLLIEEYWGSSCPPEQRIAEWLKRADGFASDWQPSDNLFLAN